MKRMVRSEIPGDKRPVEMAGWEVHFLDFELSAGEFLHLVVEQLGIDVAVRLLDPAKETIVEVDSPTGSLGFEELVTVASETGVYRFEIAAPEKDIEPGRYVFEKRAQRRASNDDRAWVAADRAYHEARQLLKKRQYRPAIEVLRSTLETWQRLELPRREAEARDHLYRAHRALEEFEPALAECEQALAWYRILGDSRLAGTLLNAATLHIISLGDPDPAIDRLHEALPLFEARGFRRGVALTLSRLGLAYRHKGRLQRALSYYERALEEARSFDRPGLEASILIDSGAVLLSLHDSKEAGVLYSQAEDLYWAMDDPRGLAGALTGLARVAVQEGEFPQAERFLEQALAELGNEGHLRSRAGVLHTLGEVRRLQGDLPRARGHLETALELTRQAKDRRSEASIRLSLGHVLAEDDPESGLEQHDRAREIFKQADNHAGTASARVRGAQALLKLRRPHEAWERLQPALRAVEELRFATERSDLRLAYFSFRQEYFEIGLEVLLRLHDLEPDRGLARRAFRLHDRRLARELLDSLMLDRTVRDRADPAVLDRERAIEQQLRDQAGREPSEVRSSEIGELIAELYRLRAEIHAGEARAPETVGLEQVQTELLDGDTLLLVYALGEERSFLWAVSAAEWGLEVLPGRQSIERTAGKLRSHLVETRERKQEARAKAARDLSEMLLGPVAPRLAGQRLAIVADGELQAIPFAALPEPGGDDDAFLIRRHEIVTLPSVTRLALLRRRSDTRAKSGKIAVFADPVFASDDPRVRGSAGGGDGQAARRDDPGERELKKTELERGYSGHQADLYVRLPGTRREAEAILDRAPGEGHLVAMDFEASRDRFLGISWGDYRILHLATHAILYPEPELSGLVLSQVDAEGQEIDGLVPTVEIARLEVPVDLVVLSACQTGAGKAVRGEGLLGLAWAFLNAGSRSVIASLWTVSDQSTSELMIAFYEGYLNQGLPPAAALRQAQLSLLDRPGSTPWEWAGFVLQGDWR